MLDHADHAAGHVAEHVDRLADRTLAREQFLGHDPGHDHRQRRRGIGGVEHRRVDVLVGREVASGGQAHAECLQQRLVAHVQRGVERRVGLVGRQVDRAVPRRTAERQLHADGRLAHARDRAQCGEVGPGQRRGVVVGADAGHLHAHQFGLGDAGLALHAFDPVADHEYGVADDRAAQRDLQHDQCRGGLVAAQGGQDREDVHGGPHCDFSWMAGATLQASQAGSSPASRLAETASTNVSTSIGASSCATAA